MDVCSTAQESTGHGRHVSNAGGFGTQANALLRKNVTFQKRKLGTNCCLISFPIFLCLLLLIIQIIVNAVFGGTKYKCGCESVDQGNGVFVKQCGLEYSTDIQAPQCANPSPVEWPAVLQTSFPPYRARSDGSSDFPGLPAASCVETNSCAATILYTGLNQTTASDLASNLLVGDLPKNASDALVDLSILIPATGTWTSSDYTLEPAFTTNNPVYLIRSQCSAGDNLTTSLASGPVSLDVSLECLETVVLWRQSVDEVNKELYTGFRKGNANHSIDEYSAAYDFGDTNLKKFDVSIWYNQTMVNDSSQSPPGVARVPRSMNLAAQAFLRFSLGQQAQLPLWFVKDMPKPETSLRLDFASLIGPLFYMWIVQLLLPVAMTALVYEKQRNLRMMMKMHGLGDRAYWAISYAYFLLFSIIYMLAFIIFGSVIGLKFFRLNDYSIQLVFYFLYLNLQIALAFLGASLFSSVRTATVCGYIYVFGTGLLGAFLYQNFLEDLHTGRGWIFVLELIPAFSLYRGLYEFSQYAFLANYQDSKGMRWKNLSDHQNGLKTVMGIIIVEWVIALPLAYYLDQVILSGSGVKKHPLFFLRDWQPNNRKSERSKSSLTNGTELNLEMERADVAEERVLVEDIMTNSRTSKYAIVCDNLKKVYPGIDGNPDAFAVKGCSLAIQPNECFGMLGPNGAGKTSTINMMIGFLTPSSGSAYINGLDIRKNMNKIYASMGVCPQHDLIWESLTGREHLMFYGRLKNLKGAALNRAVEDSLKSVNLFNGGVGNKRAGKYSGGMKRRLSVAISLIGDPQVVYLDEPSTGLDPASRSNLWNVVKQAKKGRAIILTTHSMEEAEALCDRLGIFVNGQMQCIGSAKELTAKYGGSYVFTITTPADEEEQVIKMVETLSASARKVYGLSGTQKFELSKSDVNIARVFATVEHAKKILHIQAWGISDTTLEDVFIQVARESQGDSKLS